MSDCLDKFVAQKASRLVDLAVAAIRYNPRMTNSSVLAKAIKDQTPVLFSYQGYVREVLPLMLGETATKGVVLQAFQVGGSSSKGEVTPQTGAFRFFYLDEVEGLVLTKNEPAPEYWAALPLKKSEAGYQQPPFVTNLLAISPLYL